MCFNRFFFFSADKSLVGVFQKHNSDSTAKIEISHPSFSIDQIGTSNMNLHTYVHPPMCTEGRNQSTFSQLISHKINFRGLFFLINGAKQIKCGCTNSRDICIAASGAMWMKCIWNKNGSSGMFHSEMGVTAEVRQRRCSPVQSRQRLRLFVNVVKRFLRIVLKAVQSNLSSACEACFIQPADLQSNPGYFSTLAIHYKKGKLRGSLQRKAR